MPRNRFFHCLTLAAAFFLLWETQASAYETRVVTDHANTPLFQLRFFDQGEEYGNALSETEGEVSTWQLSAAQKDAVTQAVELWADILGPGANNAVPAAINVGTMNEVNADAISVANPTWHGTPWEGSSGLAGALIGDQSMNPPAQIRIGKMNFSIPDIPSSLPTGNGIDLVGTLYHEMGHALGISSLALVGEDDGGNPVYGFDTEISPWDRHLVDRYGVTPTTDMEVVRSEPETAPGADPVFTVGEMTESGVLFKGTHVSEVLAGALNGGLPIEGFEGDSLDLSHIELDRSLMSHQDYRNYQVFMEAELAALQDIGYTIDRKNFYGFSVYGDNLTLSNGQGYFARNADGTAYLPGQPNTAAYGVGLHIYGSGNDITQTADLLACGTAGTGIRVDGEANTLRIAPGVRVSADGAYGTGLLLAYGKGQNVVSRGEIRATGTGGAGARFDFGGSLLGLDSGLTAEYRGSYIRSRTEAAEDESGNIVTQLYERYDLLDELKGPLTERFDVSGPLSGNAAAIYISRNAWVKNINIVNGAALSGDIISDWNPGNSDVQQAQAAANGDDLLTSLSFGRLAAGDGSATDAPDPDFRLRYDGNILGRHSIRMSVGGGALSFNGRAEVLDVNVREGATLSGNAEYTLNALDNGYVSVDGTFTNAGTVAPGNSIGTITINGDYHQTATGRLLTEFDASGTSDRLAVNGNAVVNGTLYLAPLPGYYAGSLSLAPITASGNLTEGYATNLLLDSPTLEMIATPQGGTATILSSRAADAYSRYAANGNAANVGRALSSAEGVRDDMRNLYAALDFSAADGSTVRDALSQLSPDAYGNAALASFDMHRMLSDLILPGTFSRAPQKDGEWHVFAQPYAGTFDQPGRSGMGGYDATNVGLIGGAERSTPGGLTVGGHVVFNHQSMTGDANGKLRGEGLYLGAQGLYAPAGWDGWNVFGIGRLGVENWRMKRAVSFNGYNRENNKDWTGFSGSVRAGGGYEADWGTIKAGPFAALDYAFSSRPSLTEDNGMGSRLHLDSETFHSLRSSLGVRMSTNERQLGEHATWKAHVSAAWNHELLDKAGTMHASFVEAANAGFSNTVKVPGRDSLGLGAGVRFNTDKHVSFSLNAGSELFRRDATSVYGNLAVEWKF